MLKNIYIHCVFLLITLSTFSQQEKTKVSGKIYYDVSHLFDTVNQSWLNEVAVLDFSGDVSLYRSFDYLTGQILYTKWKENGRIGPMPGPWRGSKDLFYTSLKNKQIKRFFDFYDGGNLGNRTYVMPEPLTTNSWKIVNETKKIDNYLCQKAIGTCKGRTYIVWFCSDIPFPFGPWKLGGLPGLIMEAEDNRKQIVFKFKKIEYPLQIAAFIEPTKDFILTKETDFEKMRQAYYDAPQANGVSAVIRNAQGQEVRPKRPVINNPMDLTSKLPKFF